jgi:hypothetical protein
MIVLMAFFSGFGVGCGLLISILAWRDYQQGKREAMEP